MPSGVSFQSEIPPRGRPSFASDQYLNGKEAEMITFGGHWIAFLCAELETYFQPLAVNAGDVPPPSFSNGALKAKHRSGKEKGRPQCTHYNFSPLKLSYAMRGQHFFQKKPSQEAWKVQPHFSEMLYLESDVTGFYGYSTPPFIGDVSE